MITKKLFLVLSIAIAMLSTGETVSAQQKAESNYTPTIIAGVRKADSWTMDNTKEGIYSLELKEGGELTQLNEGVSKNLAPLGGAVYVDGKMDGINFTAVEDYGGMSYIVRHVQYNMEDWSLNYNKMLSDLDRNFISSCGLAHDPVTGKNYGIFFNFNLDWQVVDRKFGTIDFTNEQPSREVISVMNTPMVAIACDNDGVLYGIGQDGFLYIINKSNGNVSIVGDTGIENLSTQPMSAVVDPKTNKLYWNVVNTSYKAAIYELDKQTGTATKVIDTPDNAVLVNMYIAEPQAADDAPAAVDNLSAVFEGEETTGNVSFTAPTTSYLGDPISGTLNYTISANGEEKATGTVEVGATVEQTISAEVGDNEIVVTVSNQAGMSPEAKVNVYVGPDTPMAPEDVVFEYDYDNKEVSLAWKAPAKGIHDKDLQADQLTYVIRRMEGDVMVAENVQDTNYKFQYSQNELAPVYFTVAATNKGVVTGEAAPSNKAVIGNPLAVPYTQRFNSGSSFDLFTVVNANNDSKTWEWGKNYSGDGRAEYFYNRELDADDWLITPPVYLFADAEYELKFDAQTAYVNCLDYLGVAYGRGFDVAAYETLFDKITLNEPQSQTFTKSDIIPSVSGAYYFGFHAFSPYQYGGLLLIDNISITLKDDHNSIAGRSADKAVVKAVDGGVAIANATGKTVEIFTADGRLVAQNAGAAYMMRSLPRGLYIVRVGADTLRVAVK